jgi:WhiB family transcriptional regulator, redox-sensing transcriptional regulator
MDNGRPWLSGLLCQHVAPDLGGPARRQGEVMNVANIRRLPVPIMDNWDWQLRGACRGIDSEFFFHPDGERGSGRARREAMAKQVCKGCPVLEQCRRHALAVQEPYGVWGGLSEGERDDIVRGRRRTIRVPLATSRT